MFNSWNCQGCSSNAALSNLNHHLQNTRPHVMALQETYLKGQTVYIPNYHVIRRDRVGQHGGGVALLIRKDISCRPLSVGHTHTLEVIAAELNTSVGTLAVASVYSPRHTPGFLNQLSTLFNAHHDLIAMGDLNAKNHAWNGGSPNQSGRALMQLVEDSQVRVLHPDNYTRVSTRGDRPSTIDFFITNSHRQIENPSIIHELLSDHYAISASIHASVVPPVQRPNYRKANWVQYKQLLTLESQALSELPLLSPEQIDLAVDAIQDSILSARNTSVPTHPIHYERRDTPPDTLAVLKEKRRWTRALSTCTPDERILIRSIVRNLKSALKTLSNRDRNDRWTQFTGTLNESPKNYWRVSKRLRRGPTRSPPLKRPDGTLSIDAAEKREMLADAFLELHDPGRPLDPVRDSPVEDSVAAWLNEHFDTESHPFQNFTAADAETVWASWRPFKCPGMDGIQNTLLKHLPTPFSEVIVKIFNAVVSQCYWPAAWRHAKVIALHKKGKPEDEAKSYRPISLLPSLSKTLERLIANRLVDEMDAKNVLQNWQFGFRRGHSAPQQALRLRQQLREARDNKVSSAVLLLDVASAFPSMWNEGLLSQMIGEGISPYLISSISSFLSNRSFRVCATGGLSTVRVHSNGAPQGSCLSPICYALHVAKLKPPNRLVTPYLYADDTALVANRKQARALVTALDKSYAATINHYDQWRIKVNGDKTEILWVPFDGGWKRRPPAEGIPLGTGAIAPSKCVRYLGIHFDSKLNFATHVQRQKAKGVAMLAALYPVMARSSGLSTRNKLLLYKTCIRPIFTYASPVWYNIAAKTHLKGLQTLQNKAIKQALGVSTRTATAQIHAETGIPLVADHLNELAARFFERCAESDRELIRALARSEGWHDPP